MGRGGGVMMRGCLGTRCVWIEGEGEGAGAWMCVFVCLMCWCACIGELKCIQWHGVKAAMLLLVPMLLLLLPSRCRMR